MHAGNRLAAIEALDAGVTTCVDWSHGLQTTLHLYGHVAFQAQRGDVHTVIVNGRVVKHNHRLAGIDLAPVRRDVAATVGYLQATLGEEAWGKGMHPDVPETKLPDNPYTYTEYHSGRTHGQ